MICCHHAEALKPLEVKRFQLILTSFALSIELFSLQRTAVRLCTVVLLLFVAFQSKLCTFVFNSPLRFDSSLVFIRYNLILYFICSFALSLLLRHST